MSEPAISFHDLTLGYDRHPAVHHLDATIESGALTAIVGPNGAGKSTLLKGIAGTLRPLDGQLRRHGFKPRQVAYLPQQAAVERDFPLTVFDLVAMGLWQRVGPFRGIGKRARREVEGAVAAVGLTGFESRLISTLSGGQFQRALFARLLLQDAPVILLDEPFTAVDSRTAADLLALIQRWHGERRTVLAVLHDLDEVRAHFPQALLLARELVDQGPSREVLSAENLLRARQMNEAFDQHAAFCHRSPRHVA